MDACGSWLILQQAGTYTHSNLHINMHIISTLHHFFFVLRARVGATKLLGEVCSVIVLFCDLGEWDVEYECVLCFLFKVGE